MIPAPHTLIHRPRVNEGVTEFSEPQYGPPRDVQAHAVQRGQIVEDKDARRELLTTKLQAWLPAPQGLAVGDEITDPLGDKWIIEAIADYTLSPHGRGGAHIIATEHYG